MKKLTAIMGLAVLYCLLSTFSQAFDIVGEVTSPDSSNEAVAWDGQYLWVAIGDGAVYNGVVFQIDTSGNVISSFDAPFQSFSPFTSGLTWDGANLWLVDYFSDLAYQLTTDGTIIRTIPVPENPFCLTWDGFYLWVGSFESKKVYKIDPASGQILNSFNSPGNEIPYGLAWDGIWLWIGTIDGIFRVDPTTGVISRSYTGIDYCCGAASGLTWGASRLWAADSLASVIYRIDPDAPSNESDPGSDGSSGGGGGGGGCYISTIAWVY